MFFHLPQTFIEGKAFTTFLLHLFQDDLHTLCRKNALTTSTKKVLFSVLEVDDVMLNQRFSYVNIPNVKLESPGHRSWDCMLTFRFFRKVHEMCHTFIYVWFWTFCLDWNHIRIISFDWLLFKVKFYLESTSTFLFWWNSYLFVCQKSIVINILQLNWTVKRNRHSDFLIRSVRQHFENQDVFEFFCDFHQECSICSTRRFDGTWEICIRVSMFEDD